VLSLGAVFDEATAMWRLARAFEHDSLTVSKDFSLTPDEQGRILDWCSRFGLLGILPHTALTIELPLRFAPRVGKGLYFAREHVRVNGKWLRRISATCTKRVMKGVRFFAGDIKLLKAEEPGLGPLVGKNYAFYRVRKIVFFSRNQTVLTPEFNGSKPVAEVLTRFFSNSVNDGDRFECPLPLTPAFWKAYSERVHDFLEMAMAFLGTVEPFLAYRDGASLSHLEWFLEPIGISLWSDSAHRLQEGWLCPSLLSSLARMALQDTSAGRRIVRCGCCGKPFVTSAYQSVYCSNQCGWRHRQRKSRLKRPEKRTRSG
jgi:hypothetical protein